MIIDIEDIIGLQVIYKGKLHYIVRVRAEYDLASVNIYIKLRGIGHYVNIEELMQINKFLSCVRGVI